MKTTTKTEKMRVCRLCGEEKPLDKFEKDKRVKGGRTSRCKACKAALNDRARTLYSRLKHRAKQDGQPLEVTLKELRGLFQAFDGKCIYCGADEEETGKPHHADHVVPVSEGGRHHISNLVIACASCNASKGNKPFFQFYLDKKNKISDENFMTLLYYVALTSGQPVKEVFAEFMSDYIRENYPHFIEVVGEEEIKKQILDEYKKEAS